MIILRKIYMIAPLTLFEVPWQGQKQADKSNLEEIRMQKK